MVRFTTQKEVRNILKPRRIRIGTAAVRLIVNTVNKHGIKNERPVVNRIADIAKNSGRKTIKVEDVKLYCEWRFGTKRC